MAIPTFVSAGTVGRGTGEVTPGTPSGMVANDIILLVITSLGEDANAEDPPTGGDWTLVGSIASDTTGLVDDIRITVYWHRFDGTNPNFTIPDAGDHTMGSYTAWRSCITTASPIHKFELAAYDGTPLNKHIFIAASIMTTTIDDCLIVACGANHTGHTVDTYVGANLADTVFTERVDFFTTSGLDSGLKVGSGGLATNGDPGELSCLLRFGGLAHFANCVIALEPAPPPPRRARVSAFEAETPNAPRRCRFAAFEFEQPNAPRRARVAAWEMETDNAPRRARVAAFEFEQPNAPRRARFAVFEFETPSGPRRARVAAWELETGEGPRRARVAAFELETDLAPRRARVAAFEFEQPNAPRRARFAAFEFAIPAANARFQSELGISIDLSIGM